MNRPSMLSNNNILAAFFMFALLSSQLLQAHHSTAAFDKSSVVTLSGVVKEYQYTNPHSWLQLYVTDENNQTVEWGVEGGSPNFLRRRGWNAKILQPGDAVTVEIYPLRNGDPGAIMISVILPDGSKLEDVPPP